MNDYVEMFHVESIVESAVLSIRCGHVLLILCSFWMVLNSSIENLIANCLLYNIDEICSSWLVPFITHWPLKQSGDCGSIDYAHSLDSSKACNGCISSLRDCLQCHRYLVWCGSITVLSTPLQDVRIDSLPIWQPLRTVEAYKAYLKAK